jgi:hypothetical protein
MRDGDHLESRRRRAVDDAVGISAKKESTGSVEKRWPSFRALSDSLQPVFKLGEEPCCRDLASRRVLLSRPSNVFYGCRVEFNGAG